MRGILAYPRERGNRIEPEKTLRLIISLMHIKRTGHRKYLCVRFAELSILFDSMLATSPFLLADRPLFVDYNLYEVLGNYLFNGKTKLPNLTHRRRWHRVMQKPF